MEIEYRNITTSVLWHSPYRKCLIFPVVSELIIDKLVIITCFMIKEIAVCQNWDLSWGVYHINKMLFSTVVEELRLVKSEVETITPGGAHSSSHHDIKVQEPFHYFWFSLYSLRHIKRIDIFTIVNSREHFIHIFQDVFFPLSSKKLDHIILDPWKESVFVFFIFQKIVKKLIKFLSWFQETLYKGISLSFWKNLIDNRIYCNKGIRGSE